MGKGRILAVISGMVLALPLLLVLTDFAVFAATAHAYKRPAGPEAYMAYRTGEVKLAMSLVHPDTPESGPARNYLDEPLTLEEKRVHAAAIDDVLPPAPQGWTLARYVEADHWSMRPEQAHCVDASIDPAAANPLVRDCPGDVSDDLAMAYARGDERIVIRLRYVRDGVTEESPGSEGVARSARSGFVSTFFRRSVVPPDHTFEQHGRWRFGAMANLFHRDGWPPLYVPTRLHAQRHADGELDIWIVSNASPASIRTVLEGIDYAYLDALLEPLPAES